MKRTCLVLMIVSCLLVACEVEQEQFGQDFNNLGVERQVGDTDIVAVFQVGDESEALWQALDGVQATDNGGYLQKEFTTSDNVVHISCVMAKTCSCELAIKVKGGQNRVVRTATLEDGVRAYLDGKASQEAFELWDALSHSLAEDFGGGFFKEFFSSDGSVEIECIQGKTLSCSVYVAYPEEYLLVE